jgi:hypothetical protein
MQEPAPLAALAVSQYYVEPQDESTREYLTSGDLAALDEQIGLARILCIAVYPGGADILTDNHAYWYDFATREAVEE